MEVPVINRFSGLESGMSSLPNPSFLSQIFSPLSNSLDFWKWSAVIIAVLATFSGVINRVKILFVIFRRRKRVLQETGESDDDFSVDDSASSVSSSWSEFEEEEEVDEPTTSSRTWDLTDRDFHVRGSDYYLNDHKRKRTLRLRQRRSFQTQDGEGDQSSWTDFGGGKSVVKLWDNLRLEFDHSQSDANENLVYDIIKNEKLSSIFAGKSSGPMSKLLFSAGEDVSGQMSLNLWDTRVSFQIPALIAEWKPRSGKVLGINFVDDQKVYVRGEDAGNIMIGDVRNVSSPVENATASDVETWWDADAVLVSAEE